MAILNPSFQNSVAMAIGRGKWGDELQPVRFQADSACVAGPLAQSGGPLLV